MLLPHDLDMERERFDFWCDTVMWILCFAAVVGFFCGIGYLN